MIVPETKKCHHILFFKRIKKHPVEIRMFFVVLFNHAN